MSWEHLSISAISQLLLIRFWPNILTQFWGALIFVDHILFGPNFCGPRNFLNPNLFDLNSFHQIFFDLPSNFLTHNFYLNFVYPKFFGLNFLAKFFGFIFFNPIISFLTLFFLDQRFLNPKFLSWIFLSNSSLSPSLGQRKSWSLTLKTKSCFHYLSPCLKQRN